MHEHIRGGSLENIFSLDNKYACRAIWMSLRRTIAKCSLNINIYYPSATITLLSGCRNNDQVSEKTHVKVSLVYEEND